MVLYAYRIRENHALIIRTKFALTGLKPQDFWFLMLKGQAFEQVNAAVRKKTKNKKPLIILLT